MIEMSLEKYQSNSSVLASDSFTIPSTCWHEEDEDAAVTTRCDPVADVDGAVIELAIGPPAPQAFNNWST